MLAPGTSALYQPPHRPRDSGSCPESVPRGRCAWYRPSSMWLTVVLIILASYRLTRLITTDEFPASVALRGRVNDRFGEASWPAYLVQCPYCSAAYVSAVVTVASWLALDYLAAPGLVWLAAWAGAGLIADAAGDVK